MSFLDYLASLFRTRTPSRTAAPPAPEAHDITTSSTAGATDTAATALTPEQFVARHGDAVWLVVGLGNPGARYATTRHNIGYMAVDALLDLADVGTAEQPAELAAHPATNSHVAPTFVCDTPVLIARADTYMNSSGESIGALCTHCGIPAERVVILHDELDISPGTVRIKQGGGENGHNGLKSTTEHLGTRDYVRIRIGIGRPPKGSDTSIVDFVLAPFTPEETWLDGTVDRAAQAARAVVTDGVAAAQHSIHSMRTD